MDFNKRRLVRDTSHKEVPLAAFISIYLILKNKYRNVFIGL